MEAFRLACHLIQFGGEQDENPEKVLREVAEAGWEGAEGLRARNAEELVALATLARRFGLHVVNVGGPRDEPLAAIKYNITLGNTAAEVPALRRGDWGGTAPSDGDFARAARSLDELLAFCTKHGIHGFHHAHLGTIPTEEAHGAGYPRQVAGVVSDIGLSPRLPPA
jgi:sugar phosphate isomerase/epimerase